MFAKQQDTTGNPSTKGHSRTSSASSSVVDGFSKGIFMGSTTAIVERLQAQVRQKEGEIELLQVKQLLPLTLAVMHVGQ